MLSSWPEFDSSLMSASMTVTTAVIPLTRYFWTFWSFRSFDHAVSPKLFQILVFTLVSDSPSQLFGGMYFFLRLFSFVSFGFTSRRSLCTSPANCVLVSGPFSSSRANSFVSFSIMAGWGLAVYWRFAGGSSRSFLSEYSSSETSDSELISLPSVIFVSCISFPKSAKPVFIDSVKPAKAVDRDDCKISDNWVMLTLLADVDGQAVLPPLSMRAVFVRFTYVRAIFSTLISQCLSYRFSWLFQDLFWSPFWKGWLFFSPLPFDRRGNVAVIVGHDAVSAGFCAIVSDLLRNIFVICLAFSCSLCRCCLSEEANILIHHTEEILFKIWQSRVLWSHRICYDLGVDGADMLLVLFTPASKYKVRKGVRGA